MRETLTWVCVLLIYPLMTADTKSPAWAFMLGAELAIGLYFFLSLVLEVT